MINQHGVYYVTGGLRSGKSLICTRKIQEHLQAGKKVATNFDLKLENMLSPFKKDITCLRVPDHPTVRDLDAIGLGYDHPDPDHYDESQFGLLVLDELGTWMNSRNWQDKNRKAVIDWLLHSGKRRWVLFLIIQDLELLDNQAAAATANQYVVRCKRLGSYAVPILSPIWKFITDNPLKLPDGHIATVRNGPDANAPVADRWIYRGTDLHRAYRTRQEFLPQDAPGAVHLSTYLPPWYLVGRYTERKDWDYWKKWLNQRAYAAVISSAIASAVFLALAPITAYAIWQQHKAEKKISDLHDRLAAIPSQPAAIPAPAPPPPDCSELQQYAAARITGQSKSPAGVVYTLEMGGTSFSSNRLVSNGLGIISSSACSMTITKPGCKQVVTCGLGDSSAAGTAASRDGGGKSVGFVGRIADAIK